MTAIELPHVEPTERLRAAWRETRGLYGWFATVDHKKIGTRYLFTAFVFLAIGGLGAALMRAQLARPESRLLSPETYDRLFSMHGTIMIFWYAAPILSGFGNYLVPLMIGSRDMAFPRLNAFSYWMFLLSGVFVLSSFVAGAAPDGGWFAYVPLTGPSHSPGLNMDFYALALLFLTISTTVGAINFIVTIFTMRAPGMSLSRMPLMMWSTLTASVSSLFALPALSVALVFLELARRHGFHFFDPAEGGTPVLWQHLFWVFGHPWVYIVVLPATGMASMMFPTFCRRPIVGHTYIALATVLTGLFGFGVWAHHMFASGMPMLATSFFSAASLAVSIPSGIQIFAWLGTLWAARRHEFRTPLLFLLGFIVLFVIGGISGVMTASVPFDWQATDSYFVVAHLHYVLIGINLFPVIAAFYYWLPKMTGRLLDERLGTWNFWVMFVGVNLAFFPMHLAGLRGMPRRVYTYPAGMGWDALNLTETVGAYIFAVGVLLFVINVIKSVRGGAPAGDNPWRAASLEWATTSPPPEYNFAVIPVVQSRDPLWAPTATVSASGDVERFRVLDDGKQTLETSVADGEPRVALDMPHETLWPFATSLAFAGLFTGLLLASRTVTGVALLALLLCVGEWLWPGPSAPTVKRTTSWWAMLWFCATEAMLFACLIASYFFLRGSVNGFQEQGGHYPSLALPLPMTVILLASSVAMWWGERGIKAGSVVRLRVGLALTFVLGVIFLALQTIEFRNAELGASVSAYHSVFFTTTGFHFAHVTLGAVMLGYVQLKAWTGRVSVENHSIVKNVGLYWHFVDIVWLAILATLYLSPRFW